MLKNDLLLRAARGERTPRTPVWLMRQAGRFDPEYRAVRQRADMPLEDLFRDPDLAAEISLLPRRFGVDAIIFFQDILTPLAPMGAGFVYRPGPTLPVPLRSPGDVEALRPYDAAEELDFVSRTIRLVRRALGDELPLLGFAGAPLTLAFFLLEGGRAGPARQSRVWPVPGPGRNPERMWEVMGRGSARAKARGSLHRLLHRLLDRLADMTADYLELQIEAGVDAVQLFESCADLVSNFEYSQFAYPYQRKIFARLAGRVPTILFVKDQPFLEMMKATGADVLSIGTCVDLAKAKARLGDKVAFQGNIDNRLLATAAPDEVAQAVRQCVGAGEHTGHILNLGHGLLKDTPVDNVRCLIDTCKETVTPLIPEAAMGV